MPPAATLPWACGTPPTTAPPSAALVPLPKRVGGSGAVAWEAVPPDAAMIAEAPSASSSSSASAAEPAVRARRPGRLALLARDTIALGLPPATSTIVVEEVASIRLSAPATHVARGASFHAHVHFLSASGAPIEFDACESLKVVWRVAHRAGAATAFGEARGEAACSATCPGGGGGGSCAAIPLKALGVGGATLHASFDSLCGGGGAAVPTATLDLTAFDVPPVARMCATPPGGAAEAALPFGAAHVVSPLAPALADAALQGGLRVEAAKASLLEVGTAARRRRGGRRRGGRRRPRGAAAVHGAARAQAAALVFDYAAGMPPLRVPLQVECGTQPSVARASAVQAGERLALHVSGAWQGAPMR